MHEEIAYNTRLGNIFVLEDQDLSRTGEASALRKAVNSNSDAVTAPPAQGGVPQVSFFRLCAAFPITTRRLTIKVTVDILNDHQSISRFD
ncbi:hypothetical protein IC63_06790 [Paracoccus sphaerophysae]|uniref:Uncharacterized protein n=1 Tax=Paracoccus sphaerophysae TaxID=690417 RepID=A0A099FCT1_9RHOB|nr:hypothetical protein IC63_06790 [Paracoccus sphaerophysae]